MQVTRERATTAPRGPLLNEKPGELIYKATMDASARWARTRGPFWSETDLEACGIPYRLLAAYLDNIAED